MPARPPKSRRRRSAKPDPKAFFNAAEVAAATQARDSARTPGEVLDAFAPSPLTIGEIALRPLTWADFILLEKLESPFADSSIAGAAEIAQMDVALAVYILTRPVLAANDLFSEKGRPALEREALALAGRVPVQQLTALGLKLREAFARAFSTVIEAEKKTGRSTPPPATASAGA